MVSKMQKKISFMRKEAGIFKVNYGISKTFIGETSPDFNREP
jgi:hypothetical protein